MEVRKQKDNDKPSFLKNTADNHAIAFTFLFLLLNILITLMQLWPLEIKNSIVRMNVLTITNIAAGLLFFYFAYKTDTINAIGLFSAKGILKGLLLGLPIISYWIYCALEYASIWHLRKMPKGYQVLCVLLFVLSIGFNEELAMRGVVLPVLLRHWRDKKFGILYAVLLSSVSFGVLHFFQWHENAFQAALHVLGTTLVGMFYATVFLLTKNIWAAVIVHALYDFWLYLRYFVFYFSSSMSALREVNKLLGTSLIENGNTDWILAFVAILPLFITSVIYLTLIMKKKESNNPKGE